MGRLRLGAPISGSGTNLQAIIDACNESRLDAEVRVVTGIRRMLAMPIYIDY